MYSGNERFYFETHPEKYLLQTSKFKFASNYFSVSYSDLDATEFDFKAIKIIYFDFKAISHAFLCVREEEQLKNTHTSLTHGVSVHYEEKVLSDIRM